MPNYVAELYDKDNSTYKIIAISDNEAELRSRCAVVEHLIKQDMIVNYTYDDKRHELNKEPFDSISVRPVRAGEVINNYNLFMC